MRTFRFRAWDGKEGKFVGGEWELLPMMFEDGNYIYGMDYSKIVVEQFTGILDKNGVEIYEGDIVNYIGECTYAYPVTITMGVACLDGSVWDALCHLANTDNYFGDHENVLEVIGNIHENPGLLETP